MEFLNSSKLSSGGSNAATQKFIDVAEVEEDVIVLKNGSLRAVLAVSAINYDLKSTDEQTAIVGQYQNFLNSIDFPLQIIISSKKFNIKQYMEFLSEKEKMEANELLKFQISEYKNFIEQLVSVSNIMDKDFYIVVPFSPIESKENGFFANLMARFNPQKNIIEKREFFETYKTQLLQRVEHIKASLAGIGLRITPLNTQELIELLYNSYNPATFNSELADIKSIEFNK